jgi:hypothetical protein
MNVRKVVQKTIRRSADGTEAVGSVNAAVAANVNEPGRSRTHVSSRQRIVQRGGRTEVLETEETTKRTPE